ncbi:E3 ubiquitin-protein ligase RNF144B-like [Paramormyrops kingsleyae]|uniref:E3 ubiquitin-protein ligase RNF144B n=1 Tax=Paramormyrops kingsleyae TaxID=1676925 RepID=A0A3B3R2P5_9TELE|nr:E3 ubiquitin-protein ligase RNF144B-like [Paramormyrops kingsleyae]XP_023684630.1 E3 ubiquitin-protein ligase RNF144B-like [Paramormyrops kingsleyae]XP_023684637.1 E3 ubiquitin-protein ligase RNF144B-like [Paramormyrops kingsleyae]
MEISVMQSGGPGGAGDGNTAATPLRLASCRLCLGEFPGEAFSKLQSCGCQFCTPCLQQYVQLSIRESGGGPITCPDAACGRAGVLEDSEIIRFAPEEQVQLYEKLKFERDVQLDPAKTFCPSPHCQVLCRVTPALAGRPDPITCPGCRTVFCSVCRGGWQGGHNCSELRPLVASDDRWPSGSDADTPIKQCPACGVHIERDQGCAQMLCKSCKHTFCWYCLQNLDGDIFLRHYDKGPCKYKLGHSRASVIWNRTQVVGILVGVSLLVLVSSPLLLLLSPCILCCVCKGCKGCKGNKRKREPNQDDSTV